MPKVLLTAEAKAENRETKMNNVLTGAVVRYCTIHNRKQYEIAEACGITKGTFSHRMRNFGDVRLRDIRKVAHKVGLTSEEWLQLGGYRKKT